MCLCSRGESFCDSKTHLVLPGCSAPDHLCPYIFHSNGILANVVYKLQCLPPPALFGIILVLLSANFSRLSGPPLFEIIPRINFMQSQSILRPGFLHLTLSVNKTFIPREGFVNTSFSQRDIYV